MSWVGGNEVEWGKTGWNKMGRIRRGDGCQPASEVPGTNAPIENTKPTHTHRD